MINIETTCLYCDYYDDGACTCPIEDMWYACELEEVNPDDLIVCEEDEEK